MSGDVNKLTAIDNCRAVVNRAMAGRKLTLFEIHLDDATFTANASATKDADPSLPEGEETEAETDEADEDEDEEAGGAGPVKGAARGLLVLVLLAAVAALAKKLAGGEVDAELEDLADLDEA